MWQMQLSYSSVYLYNVIRKGGKGHRSFLSQGLLFSLSRHIHIQSILSNKVIITSFIKATLELRSLTLHYH